MRFAASLTSCALFAGCVSDPFFAADRLNGVPVKTPDAPKLNPAAYETADRVQRLGRRIVEQNTFTGLDPIFHTIGVPEPILFHRGHNELFVSDGLASRCKTEAQLAAVLCGELGRMMLEKRSARAVGVDLESVPEVAKPDEFLGSGEVVSAARPATSDGKAKPADVPAAAEFARDLMRGAGFDPAELKGCDALLAGVKREAGPGIGRQLAGPAPAPQWQR